MQITAAEALEIVQSILDDHLQDPDDRDEDAALTDTQPVVSGTPESQQLTLTFEKRIVQVKKFKAVLTITELPDA